MINILTGEEAWTWVKKMGNRGELDQGQVTGPVKRIIEEVRTNGDLALHALTQRFDGVDLSSIGMRVSEAEIEHARRSVDEEFLESIEYAASSIEAFHKLQLPRSLSLQAPGGPWLSLRVDPIPRVGVYIPGGTGGSTPLVSTALMGIIPARCAGVERIVAVSPPGPGGVLNPHLLVAIHRAGAHEIYRIGGAQAVAALALGTASLAPVDKIVGPGNRYVAEAKRQLYGTIDIDKIAGPSEVAVLADDTAPAEYIAADLLAQAEHDPWAMACMVTTDPELAVQVRSAVESQSRGLSRKVVIDEALSNRGALLICRDLKDGISMIEYLAPEHVEIMTRSPLEVSTRIRNAGAIFVGPNSPQAMGDYVAGPNHTLPTGGRARFASPLGVWDFVKRTSVIAYDGAGLVEASRHARRLAQIEGLDAHERSLAIRMP